MDSETIRERVVEIQGQRSIRALAAELGVPKSLLHEFLSGKRGIKTDPIFQALYRVRPELRWALEEYQRQSALQTEVASTGPLRRVSA